MVNSTTYDDATTRSTTKATGSLEEEKKLENNPNLLPPEETAPIEPTPTKTETSLDVVVNKTKHPRKLLCLYCDRTFVTVNLKQKHVERVHSVSASRRVSTRRQNFLCDHCDKLNSTDHTLNDLFEHLVQEHGTKYFGCLECRERFVSPTILADHNATHHYENISLPNCDVKLTRSQLAKKKNKCKLKKIVKNNSKITIKRSKRLQQQAKDVDGPKKRRERKMSNATPPAQTEKCVNPYPEFDSFFRVKKITDHSIDNLKISSLTFDDVFDKAFFNRIKCNIQENLQLHIDGKLFKNEESETRISNFEKIPTTIQEVVNSNDNYGCELSLNAITPAPTALSITSQFGEDFESQIEYGAKPSKKRTNQVKNEVHYKYFTRRKYQASILQQKENRDLSKLDMWTQMLVKERQQKVMNKSKTQKEIQDYVSGQEYKSKMKREELNKILDKRGPFEDLKEEASKKAAFDKLNSSEGDVSEEVFSDVREIVNELLNKVFEQTKDDIQCNEELNEIDQREIPEFLDLRRKTNSNLEEIDKSDKIALICSSQETEDSPVPNKELVELTGEWARSRMYICAACGGKFSNIRYLQEHKGLYHQSVWVQHHEFVGNQSELYRHLSIPGLGKIGVVEEQIPCKQWTRSSARTCTKCGKQCNSLGELHRHVLQCGGDWTWLTGRKKYKYRPLGAKARRKRRGFEPRVPNKPKTEPTEKKTDKKRIDGPRQRPSDADTIQRMLANLPAKRSRRSIMSLSEVVFKSRASRKAKSPQRSPPPKPAPVPSQLEPVTTPQTTTTTQQRNTRALRSFNKVLSSRILDLNSSMIMKRKMQAIRNQRSTRNMTRVTKTDTEDEKVFKENANFKSKRLITNRLNLKSYFPVKKKNFPKTELKNEEYLEAKNRKGGLKGLVRALSLRKTESEKAPEDPAISRKRKLQRTFRKVINKVKKMKIQKPFLEETTNNVNSVVAFEEVKDVRIPDCVPTVNLSAESTENPPIPETIFNLSNDSEEKSLQAKGNFEMDSLITVDTSVAMKNVPLVSPPSVRKLRKPSRGLNDCIAMLTSKLQHKDSKPDVKEEIIPPPQPDSTQKVEEALDLTKKPTVWTSVDYVIQQVVQNRTKLDDTIDDVISDSLNWMGIQKKSKKKRRSSQLITNIIFGKDKLIIAPSSDPEKDLENPLIARIKQNELEKIVAHKVVENDEEITRIVREVIETIMPIDKSDSDDELPLSMISKIAEETTNSDSLKENLSSAGNTPPQNVVDKKLVKRPKLVRPRRKSRGSKKGENQNDEFKNFSLVINKKTKRIPPKSIVDDNIQSNLNDSVEEMDMELEDIPINSTIIERVEEFKNDETPMKEDVEEIFSPPLIESTPKIEKPPIDDDVHLDKLMEDSGFNEKLADESMLHKETIKEHLIEDCLFNNNKENIIQEVEDPQTVLSEMPKLVVDRRDQITLKELTELNSPEHIDEESPTAEIRFNKRLRKPINYSEEAVSTSGELTPKLEKKKRKDVFEFDDEKFSEKPKTFREKYSFLFEDNDVPAKTLEDDKTIKTPEVEEIESPKEEDIQNQASRQDELDRLNITNLLFSSLPAPESGKQQKIKKPEILLESVLISSLSSSKDTEDMFQEIPQLSAIITSSEMDIAPVLDEIDKSLESEDVYDFVDDEEPKEKLKPKKVKKKITEDDDDQTKMVDGELRRSRRGSKKVASYNENDLIDPLIDALESRRNRTKKSEPGKINDLFEMLKPTEVVEDDPQEKINVYEFSEDMCEKKVVQASLENYCDICKKSFIRLENLIKHKTTLTHISKLSEIEAKEAEERAKQLTEVVGTTVEEEDEQLQNNSHLKLVDIISDVLNKPVEEFNGNFSPKRYKSLGERKSFESDLPTSTILEKQINLLENIIGTNLESINSPEEEPSSTDSSSEFVKPTQYEEISEDSNRLFECDNQKQRKTLNRDEELFLECCSLLKSGSEVSNAKQPVQQAEDAQNEYSDNSRTPTPLGDTYDDEASNSNTISSNWHLDVEKSVEGGQSLSFEDVKNKEEDGSMTFGEILTKGLKSMTSERKTDESVDDNSDSSSSRKVVTKGARKVYEGLKVSIPTDELNLEVLQKPSEPLQSPTKTRQTRKSKPVKKSQIGSNILFKVNKKKTTPASVVVTPTVQDVYNFDETLDNTEVFVKPKDKLSDSESLGYADSIGADVKSVSSVSSMSHKPETAPENITKKKYKIMGKIFKNAAKSKYEDSDEESRNLPEIPEIDNHELVENYVRSCQRVQSPFMPPPPPVLDDFPRQPKMTEEEMNMIFDQLIGKDPNKPVQKQKKSELKKKVVQNKQKQKKRPRGHSDESDDEFNITKPAKKRSSKKNNQEDSGINLEQELKECIGVASRKSQRTCTSGKQNVLVEYWSSDEEAFEAMLEANKPPMVPVTKKVAIKKKIPNHEVVKKEPKPNHTTTNQSNNHRRKRAAPNPLYHWSSSSEDESESLIEIKPAREEEDDEDRPIQHGWIVGDSPKKLVTMLALTKGKKTEVDSVKEQGKRRTVSSGVS